MWQIFIGRAGKVGQKIWTSLNTYDLFVMPLNILQKILSAFNLSDLK